MDEGELWLINSYVAPYEQAKMFRHEERRRRKLLVSRKELADLWNATQRKGMTLVPLVMYFNHRGKAKLKIGIAKGKKLADKRETSAKRDWGRESNACSSRAVDRGGQIAKLRPQITATKSPQTQQTHAQKPTMPLDEPDARKACLKDLLFCQLAWGKGDLPGNRWRGGQEGLASFSFHN